MTAAELRSFLNDREDEDLREVEVRVVYHGYVRPSFNLAASEIKDGPHDDLLILVEEPRP